MLKLIAGAGQPSPPTPASPAPSPHTLEPGAPVRSAIFMGVETDATRALQSAIAQAERWMADSGSWAEIVTINTTLSSPYAAPPIAYVIVWYRSRAST